MCDYWTNSGSIFFSAFALVLILHIILKVGFVNQTVNFESIFSPSISFHSMVKEEMSIHIFQIILIVLSNEVFLKSKLGQLTEESNQNQKSVGIFTQASLAAKR